MSSYWGWTPKQSMLVECERRSPDAFVRDCMTLLSGQRPNPEFLRVLAGPSADAIMEGKAGGLGGYWPRVWAARGLLHVWDDIATDAIIDAMTHEAWRVREMAAKVVARHHVGPAIDAVVILLEDENARVRAAAGRAFRGIVDS